MTRVCFVLLLCASVVSSHPENAPEDEDEPNAEFGKSKALAYLAEDRGDSLNPRNESVTEERTVTSEQRKDGIHHKVTITKKVRVPYTVHVEKRIPKIIEVPVDKPFNVYVPKPYPVIIEKKVPYEIKVPQPQPYTVEKRVPYPVKVLVDKPYTLHVPKPYPIEVEKKYEFEVEKKVPVEVNVPVERRYPVHVIVEKEVKFPVETKVPVPIKIPHDKPIPIHVTKHVPVHVEKPVPYTLQKVVTYPVKVPFRIPIKVHYQEGESVEDLYHNAYTTTGLQNLEWTEAMTSASKAIRSSEQNHFRTSMRQGFSIPSRRGSLYPKYAYYLSPSAKGHPHQTKHYYNNGSLTKLHPVVSQQTSYEVTEIQPDSESPQVTPYLSNPGSEVIVPQLSIGSPPQQSTSMFPSQAALTSIVQTEENVSKNNRNQHPRYLNGNPPFTISQSALHNSATPSNPSPASHQFHYTSGNDQHFQAVQFGKPLPSLAQFSINTGDQQAHGKNRGRQPQNRVPSATFFTPTPQNANNTERVSLSNPIVSTAGGLNNMQTSLHQNVAGQPHQIPSTQQRNEMTASIFHLGSAAPLEITAGRNPQQSNTAKLPSSSSNPHTSPQLQPSGSSTQSSNPIISSSYMGSKTLLNGQELVYSASIQHRPEFQQ